MKIENWIYVTGAPRSSTTFVGKVLSAPLSVDYIHEPFNPDCGLPGIDQRYLYLRAGSELAAHYRPLIESLFRYDFSLKTGYYPKDGFWCRAAKHVVGSRGPFYLRLAKLNPFHTAAVIKDPIGCLLTEYMASVFPVKPVVMIRHPVPFVASLRRLGWEADLASLRRQPLLMEDYFADGDGSLGATAADPLESAAILWRALNKVLLRQASRHPQWQVVTHEEMGQRPLPTYRRLYEALGLPWSARIERLIHRSTTHARTEARPGRVQDFQRDSARLFEHRLAMLSPLERRRVYDLTADVALSVYDEKSFGLT